MSLLSYLQHGRRHLATGSDPIPFIQDWKIAYISDALNTTAGAGITRVDFPENGFYTNSPDDYEYGVASFSSDHTIMIKTPGVFITFLAAAYFSPLTVGDKVTVYWDNATIPAKMQIGTPDFILQSSFQNQGSLIEPGYLYDDTTPRPIGGTMWVETYNANPVSFVPSIMIVKMTEEISHDFSL